MIKLFQIEEPDGAPESSDGPGVAIGIDLAAAQGCAVAVSVGGNAEILSGDDGAHRLAAPDIADRAALAAVLGELRRRAERQLARPVTHAVIALRSLDPAAHRTIEAAADEAGLALLRLLAPEDAARRAPGAAGADAAALGAALEAEDLAPPAVPAP